MKVIPRDNQHIVNFFEAFVYKNRRSRWLHLLRNDIEKLRMNSSKLLKDLDINFIRRDDSLSSIGDLNVVGVFYNIGDETSKECSLFEAINSQFYFDAIFSIESGKKAVFLFHESQSYVLSA